MMTRSLNRSHIIWIATFVACCVAGCGRADPRWNGGAKKRPVGPEEQFPRDLQELRLEAEKDKNASDALVRLANGYLQYDRLREAADAFRRALAADPQNPDAVLGLWQIQARLNDTSGVLALVQRTMQINPQSPNAAAVLEEAARLLDQALTTRPQEPWILINAALCQAKLHDYKRAEDYAQRATAAAPNALTPRLMLGSLYLDQGLIEPAATAFEKLADQQPNNALVHEAFGRARGAQNRWQDAATEFVSAQRLRPNWLVPFLNAGDAYLRLGDPASSAEQFSKALALAPKSLPAGLGFIQALAAQREYEKALAQADKMLALYPDHPVLLNNVAYFLAQRGVELDRALTISQQLQQRYPGNAVILDTAGWTQLRAGHPAEAVRLLQQAAQLTPANALTLYHLGKAQQTTGRHDEAVATLQKALALGLPAEEKRDAEMALARR
jgi:tetratricopeptide (TPR) repeat protein